MKKLTPDLYRPIVEEAHAHKLMALAHVYYLKDAHELVDAGIDGFMHLVRDEVMDDGLIAKMKARNVFVAANIGGSRRATLAALPAPTMALLAQTVPASVVSTFEGALKKRTAATPCHGAGDLRQDGAESGQAECGRGDHRAWRRHRHPERLARLGRA